MTGVISPGFLLDDPEPRLLEWHGMAPGKGEIDMAVFVVLTAARIHKKGDDVQRREAFPRCSLMRLCWGRKV